MATNPLVECATGTTITFGTSAFTANLMKVGWKGIKRGSIDTTHMGTAVVSGTKFGDRTYIPTTLSDPGEIDIEIHFNPDKLPPIDKAAETITVTFPLATGLATAPTWAGTGFMTEFSFEAPLEDKMTGTGKLKMSGNITITVAT